MQSLQPDPAIDSSAFTVLAEGMIDMRPDAAGVDSAISSRTAVVNDGRVLCGDMWQAKLATNDFVPHLAESNVRGVRRTGR